MNKKIKIAIILAIIIILFLIIYQLIDSDNIKSTNYVEENTYQESINNIKEEKNNSEKEQIKEAEENEVKKEKTELEENTKGIITQISPSGFMGSSMYRVVLYSNEEVYLIIYDGNGYEEENKVSEELIAKNVISIKRAENEENYGEIIITGGTALNKKIGWIKFEP